MNTSEEHGPRQTSPLQKEETKRRNEKKREKQRSKVVTAGKLEHTY